MKKLCVSLGIAALLSAAGSCVKSEKSSNPLGPSVAGPIPGVSITSPHPLHPPQGYRLAVAEQPITFSLENATTSGVRPLSYVFEIASDANFSSMVFVREGIPPGGNGRTELRMPDPLAPERNYYWRAKAQDGANTGPYSFPIVFTIFTPVVIGTPRLIVPVGNISDLNPKYSIGNASRSGPVVGSVKYTIELAADFTFGNKLAVWEVIEQPTQTNLDNMGKLPADTVFYWRARASDAANNTGPWSQAEAFRTPVVIAPPPSAPGKPCGPPYPSTALGIVECRRSRWSFIPHHEIANFLRGVAQDLNNAGIAGGPFGILRKTSGTNCSGYSCDIICSGQGNAQKQWDVLGDVEGAQTPGWSGPHTVPNIRVDICEIQ